MVGSLKQSLIHYLLLQQFVLNKGRFHKIVSLVSSGKDYLLANFIKKNNYLMKTDKELAEALDKLLEDSKDILKRGRRN